MNRIVLVVNTNGDIEKIIADEEVRVFWVDDNAPSDRVYEYTPLIGVQHVRAALRNDPIGHQYDDTELGGGYGPRKKPSRASLTIVEGKR